MDCRLELLETLSLSANSTIWKDMNIIMSFLWHQPLSRTPIPSQLHPDSACTAPLQMWLKAGQQNYWAEGGASLCKSSVIYWNPCLAYVLPSPVFVREDFYRLSPVVTYLVQKGTRAALPIWQSLPLSVQCLLIVRHISKLWVSTTIYFSKFWSFVCELSFNLFRYERSRERLLTSPAAATEGPAPQQSPESTG